ncbi:MAG: NAD(+) synthase [Ignavibacteria bacterium RIFOXYC2_FULL_35_21]|nr:MAG: NAD(+) synthase [Ignavibacteria bacterium GWA2_35_8]OGU87723.1 MAG: NAD(+) synthase [Ignavibacteria bacterium RIFOXYA2_FULL_35_10]OGV22419.1 MAG: NAD(+) synthase [Ignavibacteria bacterium RIFOXYC2_FULL_35_21]
MKKNLTSYGYLRVAAITPEHKVASIDFNTEQIIKCIDKAVDGKCQLIVFPELSITGYTCADLFYQNTLLTAARKAINKIAKVTNKHKTLVVAGAPIANNGKLFNCAVLLSGGEIIGIVPKTYLCNTNEYYEVRWFSSEFDRTNDTIKWDDAEIPFGADLIFRLKDYNDCIVGVEICEDLWSVIPPSFNMAPAGANVLLNLSAGDEILGKADYRRKLVESQSARCLAAYIYSGCGPGESSTDLVFSGHSIIAENGYILAESKRFEFDTQILVRDIDVERLNHERIKNNSFANSNIFQDYRIIDVKTEKLKDEDLRRDINPTPFIPGDISKRDEVCKEIFSLQTTGLAKRLRHLNLPPIVLGLSGGLDSTLALLVAVKTCKILNMNSGSIHAITMPGLGTGERTLANAQELAGLLGVTLKTIPIDEATLKHFEDIGHDKNNMNTVYENAQSRERTQILMDYANECKGIVIGTSDLSELALGWSTYNGDHMSMYAVNAGVPKTLVKYIIEWTSASEFDGEISRVLNDICITPISPELLPKEAGKMQDTEKTIGPFILHDFFLYYFVRYSYSPQKILLLAKKSFGTKYTEQELKLYLKIFMERFFKNQFKRSCLPDGIKVGTVSLSPRGDWRMSSDTEFGLWIDQINEEI